MAGIGHRNDIDGLRAVAVVPVVLFHAGLLGDVFAGGFVGVDIFFVISGYLITGIVLDDMTAAGLRGIANFYRRRIRRIFPALFVMLAACLVASCFLDYPTQIAETGRKIVAAIFFVSNIDARHSIGYFVEQQQAYNPLLHTWSLSVEEQFYLLFPVLLFALRPFSPRLRAGFLLLAAIASFGGALWVGSDAPKAAFYLVQYRAWELVLGALLAVKIVPPWPERWQADLAALSGVVAVFIGIFAVFSPPPVIGLLAPCLGTAAIIHAGVFHSTWTGRVLGSALPRSVGLISYSLYLWHWPLIVFARYFGRLDFAEQIILVGLSTAIAALSWRFVEQPFRRGTPGDTRKTLAIGGAVMAGSALLAQFAGGIVGTVWPVSDHTQRVLGFLHYDRTADFRAGKCFLDYATNDFGLYDPKTCLAIKPRQKNVLILGDSHAADLMAGFRANFPNVNFLQATASGCLPVPNSDGRRRCVKMMDFVYGEFLPSHRLDAIVVSAKWNFGGSKARLAADALRQFAGRVYVIGPTAVYTEAMPRLLARGIDLCDPVTNAKYRSATVEQFDRAIEAAITGTDAIYLSPHRLLCAARCTVWAREDVPMMFDDDHFTAAGSALLVSRFARSFPNDWVKDEAAAPIGLSN